MKSHLFLVGLLSVTSWLGVWEPTDGFPVAWHRIGNGAAPQVPLGVQVDRLGQSGRVQKKDSAISGRLAFVIYEKGEGLIWSCKVDGTEMRRVVIDSGSWAFPTWSTDGRSLLAFRKAGNAGGSLCQVTWPGGEVRVLKKVDDEYFGGVFSKDMKRVVYCDGAQTRRLKFLDIESMETMERDFGPGFVATPAWSPDGKRLALQTNIDRIRNNPGSGIQDQIWLFSHDGLEGRRLSLDSEKTYSRPAWSNDSKSLAVVVGEPRERAPLAYSIEVLDADSGKSIRVIKPPRGYELGVGPLAWSPQSGDLAILLREEGRETVGIWILSLLENSYAFRQILSPRQEIVSISWGMEPPH